MVTFIHKISGATADVVVIVCFGHCHHHQSSSSSSSSSSSAEEEEDATKIVAEEVAQELNLSISFCKCPSFNIKAGQTFDICFVLVIHSNNQICPAMFDGSCVVS